MNQVKLCRARVEIRVADEASRHKFGLAALYQRSLIALWLQRIDMVSPCFAAEQLLQFSLSQDSRPPGRAAGEGRWLNEPAHQPSA